MQKQKILTSAKTKNKSIIAGGCPLSGWQLALQKIDNIEIVSEINNSIPRTEDDVLSGGLTGPILDISILIATTNNFDIDNAPPIKSPRVLLNDSPSSVKLLELYHKQLPDSFFLLFFVRAESAIINALHQGYEPEQFLKTWISAHQQILTFLRRHRKKTLLFNTEAAADNPQRFVDTLVQKKIITKFKKESPPASFQLPTEELSLARYMVYEDNVVQSLHAELIASAQPLAEPSFPEDTLHAKSQIILRLDNERHLEKEKMEIEIQQEQSLQKLTILNEKNDTLLRNAKEQEKSLKEITEENELLLLQLDQAQKELEKILNQSKNQQAELAQLREKLQDQLGLEKSLKEITEENELLLLKLHQVQEESEKNLNQSKNQQAELAQLREKLQDQLGLEKSLKEITEENELLLLKLHQIQEESEKNLNQSKNQQAELAQLREKLQDQLGLEKSLKEITEENELLLLKLHQIQEESEKNLNQSKNQQAELAQLREKLQDQLDLEKSLKEITEENELLLLQLHQAQEESEKIFIQKQQLEQDQQKQVESGYKKRKSANIPVSSISLNNSLNRKSQSTFKGITRLFRAMSKKQRLLQSQIKRIRSSGSFDEEWYLTQYPDVAEAGMEPVKHYILYGAAEDRNPSPSFNTSHYKAINPEVTSSGINPLMHYLEHNSPD